MKFIYLDAEGNQVGPVDESVIIQAIRSGKLTADSAIRNSLLRDSFMQQHFHGTRKSCPRM